MTGVPEVEIDVIPVKGGKLVTIRGAHSGFTRSRKQIAILLDDETAFAISKQLAPLPVVGSLEKILSLCGENSEFQRGFKAVIDILKK